MPAIPAWIKRKVNARRYRAELEELVRALEESQKGLASKLELITNEASDLWTVRHQLETELNEQSERSSVLEAANRQLRYRCRYFEVQLAALETEFATGRWVNKRRLRHLSGRDARQQDASFQRRLIEASGLFDAEFYVANNADIDPRKMDPLKHYIDHGGLEGRPASAAFDSQSYLDHNPDVVVARLNPLLHFLCSGMIDRPHGWAGPAVEQALLRTITG